MMNLPQPEIIITHESDLDGFVSGMLLQKLARKLFAVEVPLKAFNYNYWSQYPLRERSGWTCDLNFEARMDLNNWLVVDHHDTACVPKLARLIHDPHKSASLLCYELCGEHGIRSDKLDRLVHLSNVADLFLDENPDFDAAMDYASLLKNYSFWKMHALVDGDLEKLVDHPLLEVMQVRHRVEDPIGYERGKNSILEISPQLGYVDIPVGNSNLIINQLLKQKATPFPVLMTLHRAPGGPVNASFRSRDGQALDIAAKLQGGGHPNACGACLPRTIHHIPDALDYLRKILHPAPAPQMPITGVKDLFDAIED